MINKINGNDDGATSQNSPVYPSVQEHLTLFVNGLEIQSPC